MIHVYFCFPLYKLISGFVVGYEEGNGIGILLPLALSIYIPNLQYGH